MKRRMRNRTYGVVGGGGLYPTTYPMESYKEEAVGWEMGLEPTTTGITIRDSTN